jgi:hypothetical protein
MVKELEYIKFVPTSTMQKSTYNVFGLIRITRNPINQLATWTRKKIGKQKNRFTIVNLCYLDKIESTCMNPSNGLYLAIIHFKAPTLTSSKS